MRNNRIGGGPGRLEQPHHRLMVFHSLGGDRQVAATATDAGPVAVLTLATESMDHSVGGLYALRAIAACLTIAACSSRSKI